MLFHLLYADNRYTDTSTVPHLLTQPISAALKGKVMNTKKGILFTIIAVVICLPAVMLGLQKYDDYRKQLAQAEAGRVNKLMSIQERLVAREKMKELEKLIPTWPKIEADKWYCVNKLVHQYHYYYYCESNISGILVQGKDIDQWGCYLKNGLHISCFYISGPFDNIQN